MNKEEYYKSVHRMGRIGVLVAAVLLVAVPTIVCLTYDIMPKLSDVIKSAIPLLMLFVPLGISEVLSYTPVLGTSTYLTFITGNILNLKLPTVINAMKVADVEEGTEEADLVNTIAIATSSIVTIIIIIAGVLLLVPLQPVIASPSVQTASHYVIPALFGALGLGLLTGSGTGSIKIKGKLLAAIIPVILMSLVFFAIGATTTEGLSGVLILVMLPIIYFTSKLLYKKGVIKVILPEDEVEEFEEDILA